MAVNFPDSPTTGDTVTVNGVQYEWNGTVWNRIESSPSFINSDTAPTNPDDGDLWFNTDTLELFVWYVDGTSSQWVSVAGSAAASWNNDGSNLYYDGVLNVGIGTSTPSEKLDVVGNISASGTINGVDMADVLVEVNTAVQMPTGTTAQRPGTPATGMIRYNTDDEQFEGYDSNTTWQNLGPKAYFSAYDGTGNTNVTSGAVVTIDTQFAVSDSALFTLSSSVITINKTATYMISLDISTRVLSGSNRSESRGYLQRDTGSGFTTVTGTSVMMYNRDSAQGDNTGSATIIISLNSGDQLRLFAERQSGGDTIETLPNASRITLLEV